LKHSTLSKSEHITILGLFIGVKMSYVKKVVIWCNLLQSVSDMYAYKLCLLIYIVTHCAYVGWP